MLAECNAVFLFIAELTGSFQPGSGTEQDKIECGKQDYIRNFQLDLNLHDEDDRKDMHENVWLSRLYRELDTYFNVPSDKTARALAVDPESNRYRYSTFQWQVPIELDASASMLQYEGLLTGDKRLLEMTNVIGDTLQDPWKLEGMSRQMLKKAATPMLYG
ncbi:hypothetical protein BZG00_15815, partial [Salinivibrio kushneri]